MTRSRCALIFALGFSACAGSETPTPEQAAPESFLENFKRTTALQLAAGLRDTGTRTGVVAQLRASGPAALAHLPVFAGLIEVPDIAEALTAAEAVPELRLYEPDQAGGGDDLLVAYAPNGNERTWTEVPAYTLDGRRVALDPHTPPPVSVIIVETHGRLAMRVGIEKANRSLQQLGLQRLPERAPKIAPLGTTGKWTVRLDQIRLNDDEEPWISGAAEIYAITSGVVGDNQPQIRIVELPYLDDDGKTYYPNQIILDWSEYGYAAANILLYEHDDSTNYQTLVQALVTAVGAGVSLAGWPPAAAIAEIVNRIVAAMPSGWFSNDDDYVDSFYTIEKGRSYVGRVGVSGNATVTLTPYFLQANN